MRDCSQVRPDLGLHKDDTDWPDECEGAAHDRPEVERGVEHLDPVRRLWLASAKPVVVVVVRAMRNDGSRSCIFVASFNAIMTSPTLTACSQVTRPWASFARVF